MKSEKEIKIIAPNAPKVSFRKPNKAPSFLSLYDAKKPCNKVCDCLSSEQIISNEMASSLSTRCDSTDIDLYNEEESNCKYQQSNSILDMLIRSVSSKDNEI